jgi:hypothetical protein
MKGSWIVCLMLAGAIEVSGGPAGVTPVLVELFTSEGCSDCPPADRLLEQLDQAQPVPAADIIVMSEHVDYWDRLGWKDPFSAHAFSERQEEYARRLHVDGPYTPQMVVDGVTEFVGSDGRRALSAIASAVKGPKSPVRITHPAGSTVRVEVDPTGRAAGVYLAVVAKTGASQVLRGENRGRSCTTWRSSRGSTHWENATGKLHSSRKSRCGRPLILHSVWSLFVQDVDNGPVRGAAVVGR